MEANGSGIACDGDGVLGLAPGVENPIAESERTGRDVAASIELKSKPEKVFIGFQGAAGFQVCRAKLLYFRYTEVLPPDKMLFVSYHM